MGYVKHLKRVVPRAMHPFLSGVRRRLRALPSRTLKQQRRLAQDPSLDDKERKLLSVVESRISPGDGMYTGNGAHYFKVGLSAIHCIEGAIAAARITNIKRILDLPCGHGRVLRFLVKRFPEAEITASDLDREGVDFCARTFGATRAYGNKDLTQLSIAGQFDLIWCGSLVTHLDKAGIHALLKLFAHQLSPGGLLVFTAHGERVIQMMLNRAFIYGIPTEHIPSLIETFRKDGFGFVDYSGHCGYGISLTSRQWIHGLTEDLGLTEVYFREHGWDDHQDVYGFVK